MYALSSAVPAVEERALLFFSGKLSQEENVFVSKSVGTASKSVFGVKSYYSLKD